MTVKPIRPSFAAWFTANLALVILGLLAWCWFDYRYIHEYWTPEEMRATTDWLMLGTIAGSMLVNLWVLRRRSLQVHLLGALASALTVTALWWLAITLAGDSFHVAIGGDVV